MGKNHRHKKALKADKAKTKLKQTKTKFLPKGQNVTNTEFKIKPIVLIEQLREKGDGPLSRRKLDIKELLNRLRHYNENNRHFACEELSEMLKFHSEEIMTHLSQIILGVSVLMQDKEAKVRKSALKTIKIILEVIPEFKLEPFYNYFAINLCCALTNINPKIQEDSLKFLECFLVKDNKSSCGLMTKYSEKILPDLIGLISKYRIDSTIGRTLTVNLGGTVMSISWKINVLNKVMNVLKSITNRFSRETKENVNEVPVIHVNNCNVNGFGLYKYKFGSMLEQSNSMWEDVNEPHKKSSNTLQVTLLSIIPLLYETWLEVMPDVKTKGEHSSTPLNSEAAAVLLCILNIMNSINFYATKHQILQEIYGSKETRNLFDFLLLHFPYCSKDSKTLSTLNNLGLLGINSSQDFIYINTDLCNLYITQKNDLFKDKVDYKKVLNKIFSYINKCLLGRKLDNTNLKVIVNFIQFCCAIWDTSDNPQLANLVKNAVDIYASRENAELSSIFSFLSIISQAGNT